MAPRVALDKSKRQTVRRQHAAAPELIEKTGAVLAGIPWCDYAPGERRRNDARCFTDECRTDEIGLIS